MLSLFALLVLNVAPIQQIHLETEQGKEQFAQKVQHQTNELQQKWEHVKKLQQTLNDRLVKLSTLPKESDEWRTTTAEAEMVAVEWQAASQGIPELKEMVDAGLKGVQEPARIVNLVEATVNGEKLSEEDQKLLEHIAEICQRD